MHLFRKCCCWTHLFKGVMVLVAGALLAGCGVPLFGQQAEETATAPPVVVTPTASADAETPPTPNEPEEAAPEATTEAPATSATLGNDSAGSGVLQQVRDRGQLICGVNADLPGFGFYDNVRREWEGFDVDFCRALAAAVLGDANAVEFVGLTTSGPSERFAAVREGRVDVMFRNTTWTLSRDTAGLAFGPTIFHDGQTFMVRRDTGITSVDALEGATICVAEGTTTELNLMDVLQARNIAFTPLSIGDAEELYPTYDRGDCEAITSDSSQLASQRETLQNPEEHLILGDRISREPLGPVFIENDEQWRDVVSWVAFATIYAEELRVNIENVEELYQENNDPRIQRLLGLDGEFGAELGLENTFAYEIIRQVGNYADIYNRNLGPDTPFDLERGPNKAWNLGAGGVLAAPPFR